MGDSPTNLGQTFEGGISGQPYSEAHGAYAFCALGCLSILDAPHRIIPKYVIYHPSPVSLLEEGGGASCGESASTYMLTLRP